MANRHDCNSNLGFEFEWTASGDITITHGWTVPARHGRRAASVVILEGNAFVLSQAAASFVITAASASGKGRWLPDVVVGDYA